MFGTHRFMQRRGREGGEGDGESPLPVDRLAAPGPEQEARRFPDESKDELVAADWAVLYFGESAVWLIAF
jgi:hypothetical protein